MMNGGGPDASWAPELLDLEIVCSACYLEAQFGYVRRGEAPPPAPPVDVPWVTPRWHFRDLEHHLSLDQVLPKPLHRTICEMMAAYQTDPLAVTAPLVDRLAREIEDELRRDLRAVPATTDDYQNRIRDLGRRHWIGEHARSVPRGWLPICERAAATGDAAIPEPELAVARTMVLTERFSRLDWLIAPPNPKTRTLHLYASFASSGVCMACAAPGQYHSPTRQARSLMLCDEHRRLRDADAQGFRRALFPGTPPDVPRMKL